MKKKILVILLFLVISLTACSVLNEEEMLQKDNYNYLTIEIDNEYGGEIIEPIGIGSYAYSPDTVVTIKISTTEGYSFAGWSGESKEDVKKDNDKWKIVVNEDKNIIAEFDLDEFKIIKTDPSFYNKGELIPFTTEKIKIYFNNKIGREDTSFISIIKESSTEEIDFRTNIQDNVIEIELNANLIFEEKYKIEFEGGIWDKEGNMHTETKKLTFEVEKDSYPPNTPGVPGLEISNDEVKLVWDKVYDSPQTSEDDYANSYKIYRSDKNDIEVENFDLLAEVVNNNYNDNPNDLEKIYYYYITALDENGNESSPSKIVSTEGK